MFFNCFLNVSGKILEIPKNLSSWRVATKKIPKVKKPDNLIKQTSTSAISLVSIKLEPN